MGLRKSSVQHRPTLRVVRSGVGVAILLIFHAFGTAHAQVSDGPGLGSLKLGMTKAEVEQAGGPLGMASRCYFRGVTRGGTIAGPPPCGKGEGSTSELSVAIVFAHQNLKAYLEFDAGKLRSIRAVYLGKNKEDCRDRFGVFRANLAADGWKTAGYKEWAVPTRFASFEWSDSKGIVEEDLRDLRSACRVAVRVRTVAEPGEANNLLPAPGETSLPRAAEEP